MNVELLPRLTKFGTAFVFDSVGIERLSPDIVKTLVNERASIVSFAASGGHRSDSLSARLTSELRRISVESGFPDSQSQNSRAKFDREASIFLGSTEELKTGEALRDDVWGYIATVLIPDVVAWRFPEKALHRFEGGIRNALQRLWMRGSALDRGDGHNNRWELVEALTEDAAVQIFERPSIGGNPALARAVSETWLLFAAELGRGAMEPVMRQAMKLVRLRNEIIDLTGLGESDRMREIATCFERVLSPH